MGREACRAALRRPPADHFLPWHGWPFGVETGKHIGDGRYVIPKYNVVVEDGVVYVDEE